MDPTVAWDADIWQQQLEELLALSSILGQDVRVTWAHRAAPGQRAHASGSHEGSEALDPAVLLTCDPPCGPWRPLAAEVAVHVALPPTGVQLVVAGRPDQQDVDDADPGPSTSAAAAAAASRATEEAAAAAVAAASSCKLSAVASAAAAAAAATTTMGDAPAHTHTSDTLAAGPTSHAASRVVPVGQPVHHLPPVCVQLQLPHDYPASAPPSVKLSAMWLGAADAARLAASIVAQFEAAGGGAPILYDWLEWLRSSALAEVGAVPSGKLLVRSKAVQPGVSRAASSMLDAALRAGVAAVQRQYSGTAAVPRQYDGHAAVGLAAGAGATTTRPGGEEGAALGEVSMGGAAAAAAGMSAAAGVSSTMVAAGQAQANSSSRPPPLTSAFAACDPSSLLPEFEQAISSPGTGAGAGAFTSAAAAAAPAAAAAAAQAAAAVQLVSMLSSGGWSSGAVQLAHEVAEGILRYAASREQELFDASLVSCPICFDQLMGTKCVRLPGCGHHFCRACLSMHARTKLGDGAVESILCPDPPCRAPLPPHVLRPLLGDADFERWDALMLARALDKMEDRVYCPRCKGVVLRDEDDACAKCPNPQCRHVFCSRCQNKWHPGEPCATEGRLAELLRMEAEGRLAGGEAAAELKQKLAEKVNEIKSMVAIMNSTKPCPACKMAVTKTAGCNHMVCSYCSAHFCYKCGQKISGYDHFNSAQCGLFADDAFGAAQQEATRALMQSAIAKGSGLLEANIETHMARCLRCGCFNVKEGSDNLVRCYMCHTRFCFQCWLQLPTEGTRGAIDVIRHHYGKHGPSNCQRYTDE